MRSPQPPRSSSVISVNTEIPVTKDANSLTTTARKATSGLTGRQPNDGGWIFYDAHCPLCHRWMMRTRSLLARHHFSFVPLQTPGTAARLHLTEQQLMTEMRLLLANGTILGGADAYVEIARQIVWARPLAWFARLPGVLPLLRWLYVKLAANRYCQDGTCRLRGSNSALDWLPLFILPAAVWLGRTKMPDWVFMWAMAFALFAACKWLTFGRSLRHGHVFTPARAAGYLFGWVGLDPTPFATLPTATRRQVNHEATHPSTSSGDGPTAKTWLAAMATTATGAALLWFGARHVIAHHELLGAWTGMVGVILLLHFGSLRLLALGWQRAGVPVQALMKSPALSATLGEFWGKRWNTGFNVLVRVFLFRPWLARGGRPATAALLVFLFSGLVHELVITVPTRAGYGLPTVYFLLQAAGLLLERSNAGRHAGLGRGMRGRCFALALTILPIGCLFPPVFVRHIILPMLHAIGAY